jgi:Spy/CpxP family protein refolding chaperone
MIGLAVASLVSVASIAQAQTAAPNARHERHAARGMEGRHGRGGLFRGIKLSDTEKGRVKEIHSKYSAETKALRASLKPALQEARAARQKGDTAGVKAAWSKTQGDREKLRALMDREKAEIRTALSPANQPCRENEERQGRSRESRWCPRTSRHPRELTRSIETTAKASSLGAGGAHSTNRSEREWVGGIAVNPFVRSRSDQTGCEPGVSTLA